MPAHCCSPEGLHWKCLSLAAPGRPCRVCWSGHRQQGVRSDFFMEPRPTRTRGPVSPGHPHRILLARRRMAAAPPLRPTGATVAWQPTSSAGSLQRPGDVMPDGNASPPCRTRVGRCRPAPGVTVPSQAARCSTTGRPARPALTGPTGKPGEHAPPGKPLRAASWKKGPMGRQSQPLRACGGIPVAA